MPSHLHKSRRPLGRSGLTRRGFLALSGGALAWYGTAPLKKAPSPAQRADKWAPHPTDLIQWRYVAGRIVDGADDFGFIISLSNIVLPPTQQLLIQRKNLNGDRAFVEEVYSGTREYDVASAAYTFKDTADQTLATWKWSEADQRYELTVTTAELTLNNVFLVPQGDLIPEGGDGEIHAGRIQGYLIDSDYHADWANIEVEGQVKGTARIDMQGLRPTNDVDPNASGYTHHWFAIAVELNDGTQAWISAWRIDAGGPYWTVTIASGSGGTWTIERSLTEEIHPQTPLTIKVLEWQVIPTSGPPTKHAGQRWRLTAPDLSLDVEISVPPGQFISDTPLSNAVGLNQMQEAVGQDATGTVLGKSITTVKLAVVESTAEFFPTFLPMLSG